MLDEILVFIFPGIWIAPSPWSQTGMRNAKCGLRIAERKIRSCLGTVRSNRVPQGDGELGREPRRLPQSVFFFIFVVRLVPDLDSDVGNKLMMMVSGHPITVMVMPIARVMVVPVFIVPIMIGTIDVSTSIFIIPMVIIPVVISTCRQ